MDLSQCVPFARFVRPQKTLPANDLFAAPDHRLLYCLSGNGTVEVAGTAHVLTAGTLLYWRAGLPYRYLPDKRDPFLLLAINFDFTQAHTMLKSGVFPLKNTTAVIPLESMEDLPDLPLFADCFSLKSCEELLPLFQEMNKEFYAEELFSSRRCDLLLADLLLRIVRNVEQRRHRTDHKKAAPILAFLQENYALPLTNESVGKRFSFHPNYVNKLVVEATGMSLHQQLLNYRIAHAVNLLQTTTLSVTEIAVQVGFRDIKHFSKCFKQHTGSPPSLYRLM